MKDKGLFRFLTRDRVFASSRNCWKFHTRSDFNGGAYVI